MGSLVANPRAWRPAVSFLLLAFAASSCLQKSLKVFQTEGGAVESPPDAPVPGAPTAPPPGLDVRAYNFSISANAGVSGDLSAAGSSEISFLVCPKGVNVTDSGHTVYLSGGTGVAESVVITGGTCVSGKPGTLQFQTQNAHGGAWSISSDSTGMEEAIFSLPPAGGVVWIPAGTTVELGIKNGFNLAARPNVTLLGDDWTSVIRARAGADVNQLITVLDTSPGFTSRELRWDGNRTQTGTNESFGTAVTVLAANVTVEHCELTEIAKFGMTLGSTANGFKFLSNYVHHNGGVTSANGAGAGLVAIGNGNTRSQDVLVDGNYFVENHNTVAGPNASGALGLDAIRAVIRNNVVLNNYNVSGGQIANIGPAGVTRDFTIANNIVLRTGSFANDVSAGFELDFNGATVMGNYISGYGNGACGIVLEADADSDAADFVISGNLLAGGSTGICAIHAGAGAGKVKSASLSGNWVYGSLTQGIYVHPTATGVSVQNTVFGGNAVDLIDDSNAATVSGSVAGSPQTTDTWHAAALETGWSNAAGAQAAEYTHDTAGRVYLRGSITGTGGKKGTRLLTLTPTYRPKNTVVLWVRSALDRSACRVQVAPTGELLLDDSCSSQSVILDDVSFWLAP